MTGIELQCLRETIGLSEAELAFFLGDHDESDIKIMEHGLKGVDADVAEKTLKLRELYSRFQESSLNRVDDYIPEQLRNYSPDRVNIAVFSLQKNYEKYVDAGSRIPLVKLHRKTVWKIKEFIERRYKVAVNLIPFHETNYIHFLHENGLTHDQSSLSKWAASIGDLDEFLSKDIEV
jgi:hypothetical protein